MKYLVFVLLLQAVLVPRVFSQDDSYLLQGYVTRVASNSDFDVNGVRIVCKVREGKSKAGPQYCPAATPYIGEPTEASGYLNDAEHSLKIDWVQFGKPHVGEVVGHAVIDALRPRSAGGDLLLWADGYPIFITAKTKITWGQSLQSLADVRMGDWIEFSGKQGKDGVVTAMSATLDVNIISPAEDRQRAKYEIDPSAAPPPDKQGTVSKVIFGTDPKRIPIYDDAAMQARVNAIGEKLIPAFERNLSKDDPARINFRFPLVDGKGLSDALNLPSGVILVPYQVVEKLKDDNQLAAVLADSIAAVLEKQHYHSGSVRRAAVAGEVGFAVAGAFVPSMGFAADAAGLVASSTVLSRDEEQSARVSLELLHDAGYDLDEAPKAWWKLTSGDLQPIGESRLPPRSAYLYRMLGAVWHDQPAAVARQ